MSEKVKTSNIRDIKNIPVKDSKGNVGYLKYSHTEKSYGHGENREEEVYRFYVGHNYRDVDLCNESFSYLNSEDASKIKRLNKNRDDDHKKRIKQQVDEAEEFWKNYTEEDRKRYDDLGLMAREQSKEALYNPLVISFLKEILEKGDDAIELQGFSGEFTYKQ